MRSILINGGSIVLGASIGIFLGKLFSEAYKDLLNSVIGLTALVVGITTITAGVAKSTYNITYILMLVLGATQGQWMNLDRRLNQLLETDDTKTSSGEGLIFGISLLCIGVFPILGPLQIALQGDNTLLIINSVFSCIVAITLASNYGSIIFLVAPVLVVVEIFFFFTANSVNDLMTGVILNEMELVGGILALTSGLNILKLTKIPVLNLLPALFCPFLLLFFG